MRKFNPPVYGPSWVVYERGDPNIPEYQQILNEKIRENKMNLVKIDCEDFSGWKSALKDLSDSKQLVRDFIVITIDKDNSVRMKKSNHVLPLLCAMQVIREEIMTNEVNRQQYELVDDEYIPIDAEEDYDVD